MGWVVNDNTDSQSNEELISKNETVQRFLCDLLVVCCGGWVLLRILSPLVARINIIFPIILYFQQYLNVCITRTMFGKIVFCVRRSHETNGLGHRKLSQHASSLFAKILPIK